MTARHKPNLFRDNAPRYVRCYDNEGKTWDQYTVVFSGRYRYNTGGSFWYVGMSEYPYHPQGFGQHGESNQQIDRPRHSHLGKKISFSALPIDCQNLVMRDYCYLWDTTKPE